MPYLTEADRKYADEYGATNSGALNYLITKLVLGYVERHGLSYSVLNDVMGAMESAKQEFYRRVVAPYEDQKAKDNGDVYTLPIVR